jgi:hypothetical protein
VGTLIELQYPKIKQAWISNQFINALAFGIDPLASHQLAIGGCSHGGHRGN